MRDLPLALAPGVRPRAAIEAQIRTAVRTGRLAAGEAMPSTRALAHDLGIARSTVVAAYEQLAIEGYLEARQGRSTVVAATRVPEVSTADNNPLGPQPAHDFRPGEPAVGSFPRREWRRSVNRVLSNAADDAFGYGDPRGCIELRESLAGYLARVRMADVTARAVRVYAGYSSALGFLGEMLRRRGVERIGVEQPMLSFHRQILELVGLETVRIPVDDEGLDVDALTRSQVTAVLVTPANQLPMGVTMSSARRVRLVAWAQENDGWIIEDDYDGEFRYDRRPIGALQGLDAQRVIYAGTASKTLGPGLRLSWLIVPAALRRDLGIVTSLRAGASTIDQLALSDLIERGAYDRHVRNQRAIYDERRTVVANRLAEIPWFHVVPAVAGMQVRLTIIDQRVDERDVLRRAEAASVGIVGMATHFDHAEAGLLVCFGRPPEHHFTTAVERLADVLQELAPGGTVAL